MRAVCDEREERRWGASGGQWEWRGHGRARRGQGCRMGNALLPGHWAAGCLAAAWEALAAEPRWIMAAASR